MYQKSPTMVVRAEIHRYDGNPRRFIVPAQPMAFLQVVCLGSFRGYNNSHIGYQHRKDQVGNGDHEPVNVLLQIPPFVLKYQPPIGKSSGSEIDPKEGSICKCRGHSLRMQEIEVEARSALAF